jgi:tetratricopeptide (TPR) repeat protein
MDPLRRLTDGMRERTLWQVLGLYAAGSWVGLQVVDILANNFNLPGSFPTVALGLLILGLPIILATYFVQRRTSASEEGEAGTADTEDGTTAVVRRWLTRRNALAGGVVAFAAWGVVAAFWLLGGGGVPASGPAAGTGELPVSPSVVAVFPFSVRGSPDFEYLGGGMVNLLGTKLDGAGDLRSVDSRALLSFVEGQAGEPSNPTSGASLASQFGAGLFVLGDLVEVGGEFQITAELYESRAPSRPIAEASVEGTNAFELVDELATSLLAGVEGGPGARVRRIAAVTTTSLEAFRAYLTGESQFRAGRFAEALEAFQEAARIDSLFAMAYYRMSVAAEWLTRPEIEVAAAEKAYLHSSRLSDRDRRVLEAFLAWRRGAHGEAEQRYRAIVAEYPTDVEAWFQLGEVYFHANPLHGRSIEESREVFERVLSFEPDDAVSIIHLIRLAAFDRDLGTLDSLVNRFYDLNPAGDRLAEMRALDVFSRDAPARQDSLFDELKDATDQAIWQVGWNTAIYARNLAGVERTARMLTDESRFASEVRTTGHAMESAALLAQGRFEAARAEVEAIGRYDPASAAQYRALHALIPFATADRGELGSLRAAVLAIDPVDIPDSRNRSFFFNKHNGLHHVIRLYLSGMLSARLSDSSAALSFAAVLESASAPPKAGSLMIDLAAGIRAQVAASDGRTGDALASMESQRTEILYSWALASPYSAAVLQRYARGQALQELGRYEEALGWYANLGFVTIFGVAFVPAAHLRQAEIHEALGQPAAAARHYAAFVEMWRNADPELQPIVQEAREAVRRLAPDS